MGRNLKNKRYFLNRLRYVFWVLSLFLRWRSFSEYISIISFSILHDTVTMKIVGYAFVDDRSKFIFVARRINNGARKEVFINKDIQSS